MRAPVRSPFFRAIARGHQSTTSRLAGRPALCLSAAMNWRGSGRSSHTWGRKVARWQPEKMIAVNIARAQLGEQLFLAGRSRSELRCGQEQRPRSPPRELLGASGGKRESSKAAASALWITSSPSSGERRRLPMQPRSSPSSVARVTKVAPFSAGSSGMSGRGRVTPRRWRSRWRASAAGWYRVQCRAWRGSVLKKAMLV